MDEPVIYTQSRLEKTSSVRVVFMGTPEFAVPSLEALTLGGYSIVAVYTQPDKPAGRGLTLASSPVKVKALELGIPVHEPRTLRGEEAAAEFKELMPDLVVVAAYAKILPETILAVPEFGCLNIHPSLLPRHRGASPIPAAILSGDEATGVTIMFMEKGLDSGPILTQERVPVGCDDTSWSLTAKLSVEASRLLTETLPRWLKGEIAPRIQNDAEATYSTVITREAGEMDWKKSALRLSREVRAFNPWPGSFTRWRGRQLKVLFAVPLPGQGQETPGTVVVVTAGNTFVGVATGGGILGLCEIQLEGKKRVTAADFIRGQRDFIGSVLPC